MRRGSLVVFFLLLFSFGFPQQDSTARLSNRSRKLILSSGTAALTIGSLVGLNQVWYSQYNTGRFHFFNDNSEWLQMDKIGHAYTTYQTSRVLMHAFEWAGYSNKKKLFIGGGVGFAYLTAIEIMDGFSRGWGYSWGDQLADIGGSALAISQEMIWKEQRIQLKFSYASSGLAPYNPSLLGENKYSQILKDYNAQTYWLSVNPSSFMAKSNKFPKWLSFALGYGAYGMLGGHYNRVTAEDEDGNVYTMERIRRFYFSLDVDLSRIKTRSKFLKGFLSVVNILKFPAPALQMDKNGLRFFPLYY